MNSAGIKELITERDTRWLAVYVHSRAEKKVSSLLIEKGIESYVPVQKTLRQWSDRKKLVSLPLISGYVFVRINDMLMSSVLNTKGVVSFVKHNGIPAVIRDQEIESLKKLIELGYHTQVEKLSRELRKGERVRVAEGPLKNIEGIVSQDGAGKFIEIVLENFGHIIRARLPEGLLISLN